MKLLAFLGFIIGGIIIAGFWVYRSLNKMFDGYDEGNSDDLW